MEKTMNRGRKRFWVLSLLALLLLIFTTPVSAFDGRSGDELLIPSDEVVNDDLYVTARTFVMDGVVNGDLIAMGQTLTINGRVDGDVIAIGQTVQVNGTVTGAVRTAGFALLLGERASIGGDLIAAGYSLETRPGSTVGQDVLFAGSQAVLAGNVARHVHGSTRAFELHGEVGGNVSTGVGEKGSMSAAFSPTRWMPQLPFTIPPVDAGLTIAPSARIDGKLFYRQSSAADIPQGAVAGGVTHLEPAADAAAPRQATMGEQIQQWGLNLLRALVTLILMGLFVLWLFPAWIQGSGSKLQSGVWPNLGWGIAAYGAVFLAALLIVIGVAAGGLLFGLITLDGLARAVVGVGALSFLGLILGFILVTSFVAKIVFGQALGKWLLRRTRSPLAEHRFWPMILGVGITVVVIALLRFPPIPGIIGSILNFAVILFGLGALWRWSRERIAHRPATSA